MMEISIIFEDEDLVVIDKPAGLMVHEDGYREGETVVDWFLGRTPQASGVGEAQTNGQGKVLERSGVVHRLDTDTSGVLILAKNQPAFEHLKQQFHDRLVKKEYRAFVYGQLREKWGTIDRPIGRSARDFRLRSAERGAKGNLRESQTDWEVIKQGVYEDEKFSYLKLKPKTGRTHQLRVHLKAIDRPIVGDRLYAGKKLELSNNLALDRLALHACSLELQLPSGETQQFTAPEPPEFMAAKDRLSEAEA